MDQVVKHGWAAFVATFLYYVGLTLLVISGQTLSHVFMVASYALPLSIVVVFAVAMGIGAALGTRLVHRDPANAALETCLSQ